MKFIKTSGLSETFKTQILELWNNEFPEKLNYGNLSEFNRYLDALTDQSHVLLVNDSNNVQAWYFDFIRNDDRWFAIIIDSEMTGKGLGTQLLNLAKTKEPILNGWVIDHDHYKKRNGKTYASPLKFYLKNGFKLLPKNRLELKKLSAVKIRWTK